MEYSIIFYVLLLLVAFLYSAVGHGGASGYLALMGIWGISQMSAKPVALVLNSVVSLIAFVSFVKKGYFNKKIFLILIAGSIPFAYIGAGIELTDKWYKIVLGIFLIIAAARIFLPIKEQQNYTSPQPYMLFIIGSSIGFLSGLIGIGGGIILSPLLILMGWLDVKTTSGVSALFIFVNSLVGLLALFQKGINFSHDMLIMLIVAIVGGLLGSYFGALQIQTTLLKKILAIVLFIAAGKLLWL